MNAMIMLSMLAFNLSVYSNECIDKAFDKFQQKGYINAISLLKGCETNILEEDDSALLSKYYYGIGRSYLELGIIDSAFKYELKSYNIKKAFNLMSNINLSYNDLGLLYNKKGLQHKSIFFLNNAIRINLEKDNKELLFGNYLNLGITYKDLRLLDSASKYYLKSIEISQNLADIEKGKIYNNLAVLYQESDNYNESILFSKKALKLKVSEKLLHLQWKTNYELSKLYSDLPFNKDSFKQYQNVSLNSKSILAQCDALFKLSLVEIKSQNKSINYLKQSIELLKSIGNYHGAIVALNEYEKHMIKSNISPENHKFISSYKLTLLELNTIRLAKEYGNELNINQESAKQILDLKSELMYTNIGFYSLLLLILISISTIIMTGFWIRKNKILQSLIQKIRDSNNFNNSLSNSAKSDLGRLTFILDNRLDYEGNEILFNTLDNLINKVNNIDSHIISNNLKEAQCQILQHQQITTGTETH